MKRTIFVSILAIGAILFSCSPQKGEISGFIEGWGNDTILIRNSPFSLTNEEEIKDDTIVAINGRFSYIPVLEELTGISFVRKENTIPRFGGYYALEAHTITIFMLPGESMSIKGRADNKALYYRIKGSKILAQYSEFRDETIPALIIADSLNVRIESENTPQNEMAALFDARGKAYDRNRTIMREYILSHPDHEASGLLLLRQPWDSLGKYYELLDPKVRNNDIVKPPLDARMEQYKEYRIYKESQENIKVGNIAPDFVLSSIDNKPFKLYDLNNNKYIVLDFWGSWCPPCIAGIPKMKDYYGKYQSKMEIISIDCNEKEEAWRAAVEEYKMPWIHVINESAPENSVSARFAVGAYPTKILLAPDKSIVEIFIGEGDDFYQKLDELLK